MGATLQIIEGMPLNWSCPGWGTFWPDRPMVLQRASLHSETWDAFRSSHRQSYHIAATNRKWKKCSLKTTRWSGLHGAWTAPSQDLPCRSAWQPFWHRLLNCSIFVSALRPSKSATTHGLSWTLTTRLRALYSQRQVAIMLAKCEQKQPVALLHKEFASFPTSTEVRRPVIQAQKQPIGAALFFCSNCVLISKPISPQTAFGFQRKAKVTLWFQHRNEMVVSSLKATPLRNTKE